MKDQERKEQRPDGEARHGGLWRYRDGKLIERNGKPIDRQPAKGAAKESSTPPPMKRKKVIADASPVPPKTDPDRTES